MKRILKLFVVSAFLVSAFALADETTTTPTASGGTMEKKVDTSHNPITGSTTSEVKTTTKNAAGETIETRQASVKRNKHGQVIRRKGKHQQMDSNGNKILDEKTDESISH